MDRPIGLKSNSKSLRSYVQSPHLAIKHSTYFPVYDHLFEKYIGKQIVFVEIGVFEGGSLFMWRDYFGPDARIIGIDFNPAAMKWADEGFEIHIGDQTSRSFWKNFFDAVGPVDAVLDDGGHMFEQQIVTCNSAIPNINDGGLMVVEDTHTSYIEHFGGPSPLSFVSYAKNIADGINCRFSDLKEEHPCETNVWSVSFFESIVSFHIDRELTGIRSFPVANKTHNVSVRDYRYESKEVIGATELMREFPYKYG